VKRSGHVFGGWAIFGLILASGATAQQQRSSRSRQPPTRQVRSITAPQQHLRGAASVGDSGQIVIAQVQRARRPNGGPPRAAVAVDPVAIDLLKKVFHHTLDYVGVQRTQAGSKSSEQKVIEDTHGHMRQEYLSPSGFQGDIVLTAPNNFYHYHAHQNRTDVADWPISTEIKDQAVIRMIRNGQATLAITGQETVAGRDCAILTLSWQHPGAQAETQRRLWVDTASGIVVRREQWNAQGQISASYMTSITVGPDAGVATKDFNPGLLPKSARQEAVYPLDTPPYASVAQAEGQAGFHIQEPAQIAENYTLDGVWVFGRNRKTSVLLRYTSGVNHFSLFERPAYNLTPQQLSRPYRRSGASLQRWVATLPDGNSLHILYIGHLAPNEVQVIHDSMR
jgi:outer membrane lipoprotein-sorting protein